MYFNWQEEGQVDVLGDGFESNECHQIIQQWGELSVLDNNRRQLCLGQNECGGNVIQSDQLHSPLQCEREKHVWT